MKQKSELKQDCKRVNEQLREDAVRLRLGTKGSLPRLEGCKGDNQVFYYWGLLEFREFCRRMIERTGSADARGLIVDGARLLRVNQITTKRYLEALRARGGPLAGLGGIVTLNPHYVTVEEDGYWTESDLPLPPSISPPRGGENGKGSRKSVEKALVGHVP